MAMRPLRLSADWVNPQTDWRFECLKFVMVLLCTIKYYKYLCLNWIDLDYLVCAFWERFN